MKRKKRTAILAVLILVLLFSGCSGKETEKEKEKESDPNVGLYKAVSAEVNGNPVSVDMVAEELTIELKDDGKGELNMDGHHNSLKWSRSGRRIEIKSRGTTMEGTVKDGVLNIPEFGEGGLNLTLECRSLVRQASRSGRDRSKKNQDEEQDDKQEGKQNDKQEEKQNDKQDKFAYDMEEAKKYVGDWIGYMDLGFAMDGRNLHYGIPLGTGGASVYARIVLDENGQPVVYMRAEMRDWLNFREISATLDENSTMRINGIFADNGWAYVLSPPDENNRKIEIGGPFMTADGGELFHVYLKPIGAQWDRSELPNIKDEYFTIVNNNTKEFGDKGYTLDEVLAEMQETYDVRQNLELQGDEQIHLITDELPDASMLYLY